ncbi:hypothetical protein [Mesorhizobium sp. A623]
MNTPAIKNQALEGEIGILQRRRIEAAIIAPIYEGMVREIGEKRAQAILDEAIRPVAKAKYGMAKRDALSRASDRKVESGFRIIPMLTQSIRSSFVRPIGHTAI